MSESRGRAVGEVPRVSKARLFEEVAKYNVPLTGETAATHPIPKLHTQMGQEHKPIFSWMASVHHNLNGGFGGNRSHLTPEVRAFDNAAIIAYGLIRVGYDSAGIAIPGAKKPPEWYMWIRDERQQSVPEMFETFNKRAHAVEDEYPDYVEATYTWAAERLPWLSVGQSYGAVGIAAAEMYYAFARTEAIAAMEQHLPEEPEPHD